MKPLRSTLNKKTGIYLRTFFTTGISLIAFAANSVFARKALGEGRIDPASFTIVRLISGAAILWVILKLLASREKNYPATHRNSRGNWKSAAMLFAYAATFSFAYVSLKTGTGALILFGAVQITMILVALISGGKLHVSEWIGLFLAFFGFIVLVSPGLTSPSLSGLLLMTIAGISWGLYTLQGQGIENPLEATALNFSRSLVFVVMLALFAFKDAQISGYGILLAVLSGTLSSGVGYSIWYVAVRSLTATQAAVVQLIVPVLAAFGGVVFVSEKISLRLTASAIMILGGVALVLVGQKLSLRLRMAK